MNDRFNATHAQAFENGVDGCFAILMIMSLLTMIGMGYVVMKVSQRHQTVVNFDYDFITQNREHALIDHSHMRKIERAALQHHQVMDLERLQQVHRVELERVQHARRAESAVPANEDVI